MGSNSARSPRAPRAVIRSRRTGPSEAIPWEQASKCAMPAVKRPGNCSLTTLGDRPPMEQLVDVSIKFYSAEGDPAIIDAVVEAVYAVLSIDNVRLMQDGDDDVLLISAGR